MKDLGPPLLKVKNTNIVRTDIEIVGARNHKIYCSHYEPLESERKWNIMPCVIYCHGNSSSRIEAKELVTYLLPENITLFCFDFPGCGQSEGEYISLGHYEKDEIIEMENLEKGGVIENEILFDNDDVLHIFWNTLMGLARTHISNIILIQSSIIYY